MALLLDTNIFFELSKDNVRKERILNYINPQKEELFISYVVVAESLSSAYQAGWGNTKTDRLIKNIEKINIIDIKDDLILSKYIEIDAFSQNKYKGATLKTSARNMGKNDIWIAATASALSMKLVTTDKDFIHLKDVFISLNYISTEIISELKNKK